MQYLGGKFRIRKQVAAYLESVRAGRPYFEPFVGGAWVMQEMGGVRYASDKNKALISMYCALQSGWIPPEHVTKELYTEYKNFPVSSDPLTAFIGIGCTYSGIWFSGFIGEGSHASPKNSASSLRRQSPLIKDVEFHSCGFSECAPENMLVYCDPPYFNTAGYAACGKFDHTLFWNTVRQWSKNNTVIVSEYQAPSDFTCVLEIPTKTDMRVAGKKQERIEKLFRLL